MKKNQLNITAKIILGMGTLAIQFITQTHLAFALTCENVQNNDAEAQKYFLSIQEENIGTPTKGENVIDCLRETKACPASSSTQQTTCSTIKSVSPAGCASDATACQRIQIFYGSSGEDLLYTWVGRIYKWAATTIGIVAVLFMVFGGIEIASAGGDSAKIEKAKERILQSLAGLVILFLSALILYTVNPNFFTVS